MMHICFCRSVLALVALVLAGCTQVTIAQYSLQGDPSRGADSRLAIGRGIARGIQLKAKSARIMIWPDEMFQRRIEDVSLDEKDDWRMLFAGLYEYAAQAERTNFPENAQAVQVQVSGDVDKLRSVIRFPGFDQISVNEKAWELINPVSVFGGFGKTEFIIVRDDSGNYSLKSAAFDPTEVIAAGVNTAMQVLQTVAAAYGVPVTKAISPSTTSASTPGKAGTTSTTPSASKTGVTDTATAAGVVRESREVTRLLEGDGQRLRDDLAGIQKQVAGTTPIVNRANAKDLDRTISDVKRIAVTYLQAVKAHAQGTVGLEGMTELAKGALPPPAQTVPLPTAHAPEATRRSTP